jgi:hypothetical protein
LAVGETGGKVYGTLVKFDSSFQDTLQAVSYDLSMDTRMELIIKNNKGNLIVGGEQELSFANYFPFLYEMDLQGNIIWSKSYSCGTNCDLIPLQILQAADDGYFFTCAELHNTGGSGADFVEYTAIIKTDSLGNEQYRLHPGNPENYAVAGWVLPTDDGNYITAYSDPFAINDGNPQANPESTIWFEKFDELGNQLFAIDYFDFLPKLPNQNGMLYTIRQLILSDDNNFLIVGYLDGVIDSGFILKVAHDGLPIWYRFYSPPQSEGNNAGGEYTRVYGVTQTTDGGYIMAGEYFSSPGNIYPEGIQTAIAVKVDEFGCLEPGCHLADAIPELTKADLGLEVYPNPASETVNISVGENVKVKRIRIYEVMGRVVLESRMNENNMKMDVGELLSGVYLVEVVTKDGYKEIQRLVISKN